MNSRKGTLTTFFIVVFIILNFVAILYTCLSPDAGGKQPLVSSSEPGVSLSPADTAVSEGDTASSADVSDADVPELPPVFSYEIYNVGDTFTMGSYEQDNDESNGTEPVEWLVIDKNEEAIMVVSRYALFPCQYYKDYEGVKGSHDTTWETCRIRERLNGEFYDTTFTDEERAYIRLTHNVNLDNPDYDIPGGNDTDDYVFFLSHNEVYKYFPEQEDRKCAATPYAIKKGAYHSTTDNTYWWLRTPGKFRCNAEYVFNSGVVYSYGSDVGHRDVCARPAMWLDFVPEN